MSGHVLAIGGGAVLAAGSRLEELLLQLSPARRPRVAFLPTAAGDADERIELFEEAFGGRDCEREIVRLFGVPDRPAERVAAADVVYVNGGNTANALALWRVHGVDRALRDVWQRGGVLGGWSAGAICWFEDSVTDSFGPLRELRDGLALLAGTFCPHYDAEPERRPVYTRLVREGGLAPGYAADDDAAFVFRGTQLVEVVSQREGARGYRVTREGEEPLGARLL